MTLPVRYQFTIGVNGVATSVPYGEVEAIRAMDGVESVYVENQYERMSKSPTRLRQAR